MSLRLERITYTRISAVHFGPYAGIGISFGAPGALQKRMKEKCLKLFKAFIGSGS